MDVSTMYVPNASKWMQYYKDGIQRYTLSGKKRNQRGGSIVGSAKTVISPIEYVKQHTQSKMEIDDIPVKIISPAQATVEQASTEIEHKTHVNKGIKRQRKTRSFRSNSKRRRLKTKKTNRKKGNKKLRTKKKKKISKSNKRKPRSNSSDIFS